jgi:hypothetical protein
MASKKNFSITIDPEEVVYSTISKSKDGYNSARVVVKRGDKEYMSISYEWEGEHVPDFAMSLMGFMKANEIESGKEYEEGAAQWPKKKKKKKKKSDDEDEDY